MTDIIALDVDGVINCFDEDPEIQGFDDYRDIKASPGPNEWGGYERKYTITYSPSIIKRLLSWHESDKAEIRWLTTWGRGANLELSRKLGLPGNFLVVGEKPDDAGFTPLDTQNVKTVGADHWWKFTCVKRLADENPDARIVWIDDDLQFDRDAVEWVAAQSDRVLGVCPDTTYALTAQQLDLIEHFISEK